MELDLGALERYQKRKATERQRKARSRIKLYGDKCFYCKAELTPETFSRDHKTPKSKGGRGMSNMVASCKECNLKKGDTPFEDFLREIGLGPSESVSVRERLDWCY